MPVIFKLSINGELHCAMSSAPLINFMNLLNTSVILLFST